VRVPIFFAVLVIFFTALSGSSADWSSWRGPEGNGVSREKNLPSRWSPDPTKPDNNLVWKVPFGGRTTPIVQQGRVYLIGRDGEGIAEQERVLCFDANTGKLLGEHRFNVFHTDIVSVRLGWTNLVGDPETGNVYAHGTQGLLFCFDKELKVLWQKSLTEEFGRVSGYGGRVTSPIIDEDLVIIGFLNASWGDQAVGRNRFMAMRKKTGEIVWWASTGILPKDTYYSTPVVGVIQGQRTMVSGGGDGGVHAFQVRTGKKLWSYPVGPGSINCSPVLKGDYVFIGQGEENDGVNTQGRVVCVDGSKVKDGKPALVWKVDGIKVKFASPVLDGDLLYLCGDTGQLYCLDANTGRIHWEYLYGKNTKGSPVLADGKLYLAEVNSRFHILKPSALGVEKLHTQFFRSRNGTEEIEINGSPAIANGRIYFMTGSDLFCIGAKEPVKAEFQPEVIEESKAGLISQIALFPADIMVGPGTPTKLELRGFDSGGQFIGLVGSAEWSLAGQRPPEGVVPLTGAAPALPPPLLVANLEGSGEKRLLIVAGAPPAQFGRVLAKVGDMVCEARVRVVPNLPYRPNFANIPEGRTPGGWINCAGKFAIVPFEGRKVLKKLAVNPSPLVSRANAYITAPELANYTIQSDVMGTKVREDLPDMGLVANRYSFMLAGNTQQLRLVSWDALPRVDKSIAFPWKEGAWYTMKLTTKSASNGVMVSAKVWLQGAKEPEAWTVEFLDPVPNRQGSAAIYANATGILDGRVGCEVFFENLSIVQKNEP